MNTNEKIIWDYFIDKGLSECGCAGLMGNLYAESALNPHNLQGAYNKKFNMTDDEYTAAVDSGEYVNFIRDSAGYGLAQWTYWTRKRSLYNYAKECGKSIGDLEMQLDFLYKELTEQYASVWSALKSATSVLEASNIMLFEFEKPANQGEAVQQERASFGQKFFDKLASIVKGDNIPDEWAKEAVDWAIENKILLGDGVDYKLHSECTRQEMLVFLYRLYQLIK